VTTKPKARIGTSIGTFCCREPLAGEKRRRNLIHSPVSCNLNTSLMSVSVTVCSHVIVRTYSKSGYVRGMMLFIIQQEWYRGIGDKLPSLRIEMEAFFVTIRRTG